MSGMDIKRPERLFPQTETQGSAEVQNDSNQEAASPGGITKIENSIERGIHLADFLESSLQEAQDPAGISLDSVREAELPKLADLASPEIKPADREIGVDPAWTKEREIALMKFEQMLPKLMSLVGIDSSPSIYLTPRIEAQKQEFAQILQQQLGLEPDQVVDLVNAIAHGGTVGVALALSISSAIAGIAANGSSSVDLNQLNDLAKQYNDVVAANPPNFFGLTNDVAQDSDAAQAILQIASTSYPDPAVTFSMDQMQTMGMLANMGNNCSAFILSLVESQITASG
jgi:hypothetical protein